MHGEGPLLVVAGPGSGKTYSIVLRALNVLLLERATAKEIVLCTFTEKAAFEMRDRLSADAQKVGYRGDLSELRVSTIHGLCNPSSASTDTGPFLAIAMRRWMI
jgi:DNA helicase II / ATP-dependent DNA helicase PcrA